MNTDPSDKFHLPNGHPSPGKKYIHDLSDEIIVLMEEIDKMKPGEGPHIVTVGNRAYFNLK